jgi:hypothetical protein
MPGLRGGCDARQLTFQPAQALRLAPSKSQTRVSGPSPQKLVSPKAATPRGARRVPPSDGAAGRP